METTVYVYSILYGKSRHKSQTMTNRFVNKGEKRKSSRDIEKMNR